MHSTEWSEAQNESTGFLFTKSRNHLKRYSTQHKIDTGQNGIVNAEGGCLYNVGNSQNFKGVCQNNTHRLGCQNNKVHPRVDCLLKVDNGRNPKVHPLGDCLLKVDNGQNHKVHPRVDCLLKVGNGQNPKVHPRGDCLLKVDNGQNHKVHPRVDCLLKVGNGQNHKVHPLGNCLLKVDNGQNHKVHPRGDCLLKVDSTEGINDLYLLWEFTLWIWRLNRLGRPWISSCLPCKVNYEFPRIINKAWSKHNKQINTWKTTLSLIVNALELYKIKTTTGRTRLIRSST